jgi:2-dehydropantoate 2-reductase
MRIMLLGAGAIGCDLATSLGAMREIRLSIVARGETPSALRRSGIKPLSPAGEGCVPLPAAADPAELPVHDVVLVTLKGHQGADALREIASLAPA